MNSLLVFLSFLMLADFSSFTFCRENSRGPFETQCVQLDAGGKGEAKFKRRGAEMIAAPLQLSAAARDRFDAVIAATGNLNGGEKYESGRKVADLGKKHLTLVTPEGTKEATYNFSERKEVTDLTSFFEALLNQQTIGFDLDNAIQFDRLSVPKRLDQIETELKSNRIADPDGLIGLLEKIESDQRVMNYARDHAGKIKRQIQAKK
jgi:hypothetical protein